MLEASGWAVCFLDIVAIKIFVGDSCLGVAEYGRLREDVASACPEYPRARQSGFHFKGPIGHCGPGPQYRQGSGAHAERDHTGNGVPDRHSRRHRGTHRRRGRSLSLRCRLADHAGRRFRRRMGQFVPPPPSRSASASTTRRSDSRNSASKGRTSAIFSITLRTARQAGFSFRQYLNIPLALGEHVLTLRVKDKAGAVREMPLLVHAVESNEEAPPSAAVAPGSDPDLAISMDLPKIVNGAAEDSVISSLSIAGWALARTGVKAINIAVDGKHLSTAHYGVRREDVASAFPTRADALMSGFAALIPNWLLPKGSHRMSNLRPRLRGQVRLRLNSTSRSRRWRRAMVLGLFVGKSRIVNWN